MIADSSPLCRFVHGAFCKVAQSRAQSMQTACNGTTKPSGFRRECLGTFAQCTGALDMLDLDDPRLSRQSGFFKTTTIAPAAESCCSFEARTIDDEPELLEQSYRLRYQVYCMERKFLPAENYPDRLEMDEFDQFSTHVGVVDLHGRLAGTARIVKSSIAGLPLLRHCFLFLPEKELYSSRGNIVEISRVSVSRHYRHQGNGHKGSADANFSSEEGNASGEEPGRGAIMLAGVRGVYQAVKRLRATHWISASDRAMQRLMRQYGIPIRLVGPSVDYYGPVAPCLVDLAEFDKVILTAQFPALASFTDGLEPEIDPRRLALVT
ncbi:MAG: PEP-CTERM/exosortase system-associated acyltransferase [Vicinamibacterales bacterium]